MVVMDKSLYAIGKQLQWQHEELGEDKMVVMFSWLYIEMAMLTKFGHLLDVSGWSELLADEDITTSDKRRY